MSESSRSNLIVLHGALGSEAQFVYLKEFLSSDFEVFSFNFSGHGGRAFEGAFSIDRFVNEVFQFMQELSLSKASFFGYSMGGYVALHFAHLFPEKCSGIFTLGTKFQWSPESAARETAMLNVEKMKEKIPQFCDVLRLRHEPLNWEMVVEETKAMMTRLGNGEAIHPREMRISVPVTISVGDADNMVTQEESAEAAASITGAVFKVFEGFKHPIEQVDQQLLAREIQIFLSAPRKS
jgi:pimeloyl-ACP methyl ester carboxylesterase